jgi:hypothetical protein
MVVWTPVTEKLAFLMAKMGFTPEDLMTTASRIGCSEAELRERIFTHMQLLEGKSLKNVAKLTLSIFRFGSMSQAR